MADALRLKEVVACVSPRFRLGPISLTLTPGEILAVIGENGSGKTSLLRTILGEIPVESGELGLGPLGTSATPLDRARFSALVPQIEATPFHFTARECVLLGRLPHAQGQWETPADLACAADSLALVEAAHLADRLLEELSGGERQRIRIARALAQEPRLLLLDEPTAHIDLPARQSLRRLVGKLAAEGMALVVTTHDLEWGSAVADQIMVLKQGGCVATGFDAQAISDALGVPIEALGTKPMLRPRFN